MKKIFRNVFSVAIVGALLSSCDLNLFPEATQVYDPSKPFFYVENDVEGAHNGVYTYFRSTCGGAIAYTTDLMLQGFNATAEFGNRNGSVHRTDDSFTTSDDVVESIWGSYYIAIKNYNIYIEAAEQCDKEKSFYNAAQFVKAEALIARAYSYLQLARLFAPAYSDITEDDLCVPLVLKYNQTERPKRATNKQVYDQIAKDLEDARAIFESAECADFVAVNEPCALYFTPDVISFIQARYLLDVGEYAAAADTAKAIINRGVYTLSETAKDLVKANVEDDGTEAIMQCYASLDEGSKSYGIFLGFGVDEHSNTGYSFSPDFLPSKVLISAYENKDLRRTAWFELSGTGADQTPFVLSKGSKDLKSGINVFAKYRGNATYNSSGIQTGQTAAKPFQISELYLIAAEALYKSGSSDASTWLQKLQLKRKASTSNANPDNLNLEWFRETIGDGLYFFYLKRNEEGFSGRAGQDKAVSEDLLANVGDHYLNKNLEYDDKAFVWPIPAYEIRCNANLEQNPAWK